MTLTTILNRQRMWASTQWPGHDSICAPSIDANLFRPLDSAAKADFARGAGNELGRGRRRPKMSSLRSSSALVCNVFEAWRGKPLADLASSLGISDTFSSLNFEQPCAHGLDTIPPNIDVVLLSRDSPAVGIECKFAEPYGKKKLHSPLQAKYFDGHAGRWKEWGLSKCQEIAESVGRGSSYRRLSVGQLLKHVLGLANLHKSGNAVRLLYLWYDAGTSEAEEHRAELQRFGDAIGDEVFFRTLTYQDLFQRLRKLPEPTKGYFEYLERRYFAV